MEPRQKYTVKDLEADPDFQELKKTSPEKAQKFKQELIDKGAIQEDPMDRMIQQLEQRTYGDFNAVKVGMRHCGDCEVIIEQGYVTKVIHPTEGEWNLSGENIVRAGGRMHTVHPDVTYANTPLSNLVRSNQEMMSAPRPTPKKQTTQEVLTDSYEGAKDEIEDFPAFEGFMLVLTLALLVIGPMTALLLWRKLKQEDQA